MTEEAEQLALPVGPVLLKTKADRRSEELWDQLETDIAEMKEDGPNIAGYFVFIVDADKSIRSNAIVAQHSPYHKLMWPEMVKNACFLDCLTRAE